MADHFRYDFPDLSAGLVNLGACTCTTQPLETSLPFLRVTLRPLYYPSPSTALLLAFLDVLVLLFAVFPRLASR